MATTNWQDYQPEPTIQPLFAIDPDYCCGAFFSGYEDPALVSLTHEAIEAPQEAERIELFAKMQEEFAQASYVLPLYNPMLTFVASPELEGFFAYPNNLFAFEDWSLGG
jgi:ABC-type transport system substrate-binding protein